MIETILSPESLQALSDKNIANQYAKDLYSCDGPSVLESFIDELPPKERKVIRLKFWHDMDFDEISYETRIRRNRVEEVLSNAISLLRQKMIEKLVGLEPSFEFQDNLLSVAEA
jgi:RNA polymerase sigma factor (sigma-70 family)